MQEERLREWTVKFPSDLGNWFVSCCPLFQKAPYYSGSRTTIMCAVAVVCILSAFSFGFLKRNGPLTAVKIVSKRRERAFSTLLEAFTTIAHWSGYLENMQVCPRGYLLTLFIYSTCRLSASHLCSRLCTLKGRIFKRSRLRCLYVRNQA